MARIGRPSKLTPELQAAIVQHLEAGNYLETAAQAEGVGVATLHSWLKRGREQEASDEEGRERAFLEAVACARARAEVSIVEQLRHGDDPKRDRALTWLLERTRKDRFGASVDVTVRNEAIDRVLDRLRENLDPAAYRRVLECLDRGEGAGEADGAAGDRVDGR